MRHGLIIAGGAGTRLWPLSRASSPKQFQTFIGDQSLIQQAFERLATVVETENIWVVTGSRYIKDLISQLPKLNKQKVILEPIGRNTAPAIGLATLKILESDSEAIIASMWADHHIGKPELFKQIFLAGLEFIEKNSSYLITIGINPTEPDTGLGYIKMGEQLEKINDQPIFKVDQFIEKPDLKIAKKFVGRWEYLWNSGYFVFQAADMKDQFRLHAPKTLAILEKFIAQPSEAGYKEIPAESIDKAIVEKLDKVAVVPADLDWSDIGSWATLHKILQSNGSTMVSRGNHHNLGSEDCLVFGNDKLIATIGLKNIVVIDTEDATLICDKSRVQEVKQLVEELREKGMVHHL